MIKSILAQIQGFITGILASLAATLIFRSCWDKHHLKFRSKTLCHSKNNLEIQDVFENNIRKQFALDQTFLIYPELPQEANFSRCHSYGQNNYFIHLQDNNVTSYRFKFWNKINTNKWIEIERINNKIIFESRLAKNEYKKILGILKNTL
jgi:hypothetical protein